MVILAIDSGVERTGYAVFDKNHREPTYITSGLIKTSQRSTQEQRIAHIYKALGEITDRFKIEAVIIEKLFFFKNHKTAIQVAQAQGAVMLLAAQKKLPVIFLTPLEIKQVVTGYGQSDKKSVQKMLKLTLKLNGELKQDDQADAIACGLAYCYLNKNLIGDRG